MLAALAAELEARRPMPYRVEPGVVPLHVEVQTGTERMRWSLSLTSKTGDVPFRLGSLPDLLDRHWTSCFSEHDLGEVEKRKRIGRGRGDGGDHGLMGGRQG